MQERRTARVLLLNGANHLLLMKVRDPSVQDPNKPCCDDFWCTIGGRIEPGEDAAEAAAREVLEETGLGADAVIWGPAVWYGEHVLNWGGVPTLLHETFIAARTEATAISERFRTEEERAVIVETKWWPLHMLAAPPERILPAVLPQMIPSIMRNEYPAQPIHIEL